MPRTPKQTDRTAGPAKRVRSSTKKPNGNGGPGNISTDEVARRAYDLYQSRGGAHGADFDDWIEAEKQLSQHEPTPAEKRRRTRSAPDTEPKEL